MGAKQSKPNWKGGDGIIGALNLNTAKQCFPCCGIWWGCYNPCPCAAGVRPPVGPEWDAAMASGFQDVLDDAWPVAQQATWGCCMDPMKVKPLLDADWTQKANALLAEHGLVLEVCTFYTDKGAGLMLQLKKLNSTAPAVPL